jgi:putative addiction module component (TIGR02574 family)
MEAAVLEKEALMLPMAERALLADRLLQTLEGEDESVMQAWADEAERRLELFRAGKMTALDGQTVVESIRKRLR